MYTGKHSYYSTNVYPSKEEQAHLLQYQHVPKKVEEAQLLQYPHVPKQGRASTVITVPTCTHAGLSKHSNLSAEVRWSVAKHIAQEEYM